MGLFMTLEEASAEEAALLRVGALPEAAQREKAEGRLRVFDLHCDTLDRLAFHGDPTVPGGFAEHDAAVAQALHERRGLRVVAGVEDGVRVGAGDDLDGGREVLVAGLHLGGAVLVRGVAQALLGESALEA